ncbi:MAG: RHS repeat-associated core domain-containing protein, partial [Bacteroidales bacterium]|nr:RHS repeat-associated core domain-containing protein [Bacteroidales bacterium]
NAFDYGTDPGLTFHRGWGGHEYLPEFGLYNCNARLYDPYYGRFLSPDPFVQVPDFTQNLNRYSYALNNPLKYIDKSGELFEGTLFTTIFQFAVAVVNGILVPYFIGFSDTQKAGKHATDAWREFGTKVKKAVMIDIGLLMPDPNLSPLENALSTLANFTIAGPANIYGYIVSHFRNNFSDVEVQYYHGAVLVNSDNNNVGRSGMTSGIYINGVNLKATPKDDVFIHEYGHTKQKYLGLLYMPVVGLPSLAGAAFDYYLPNVNHDHEREWYEAWANQLSYSYHDRYGYSDIITKWDKSVNPLTPEYDWFFYSTMLYYAGLIAGAILIIL